MSNLNELEVNLKILEETKAKYVESKDVPPQIEKEIANTQEQINNLKEKKVLDNSNDIRQETLDILGKLDEIHNMLLNHNFDQKKINEIESLTKEVEHNLGKYENELILGQELENCTISLKLILKKASQKIRHNNKAFSHINKESISENYCHTNISVPEEFTDRIGVIKNLKEEINKKNIVIIAGIDGIGKTYTAKKLISSLSEIKPIWIECTKHLTIEDFFFEIANIATIKFDSFNMSKVLTDNNKLTENKISILIQQLDRIGLTVIINKFHKANKSFEEILTYIKKYSKGTKFLILTNRKNRMLTDIYKPPELLGIDMSHIKEFLMQYELEIKNSWIEPIYKITKGHPLSLTLFASLCKASPFDPQILLSESKDKIEKEIEIGFLNKIYEDITIEEKVFLENFSVFSFPVNRKAFEHVCKDSSYAAIHSVINRFLISRTTEYEFVTHELIRNFFYKKLVNKKDIHKKASEYYILVATEKKSINDYLLAYNHLIVSEHYSKALKIVMPLFNELLLQGRYEISWNIINDLIKNLHDIPVELRLHKATIFEIWGKWDECRNILDSILETDNSEVNLKALNLLLKVIDQKGEHDLGLELYEKYKIKINTEEESSEIAHLFHRVSRFYHEKNDYGKTKEFIDKSLEISNKLEDVPNMIRTRRLLGVLHWFFGHYHEAHDELFPVLTLCQETKNKKEESDTLKHIAIVYIKKGKVEKSIPFFKDCIKINRELNYQHGLAWSLMNYSDALISFEDFSVAQLNLDEALNIFETLSEKTGIINTLYRLGKVFLFQNNRQKSLKFLNKAYKLANENNFPIFKGDILELLFEYYLVYDKPRAISNLKEAIDTYKSVGSNKYKELELKLNQINLDKI